MSDTPIVRLASEADFLSISELYQLIFDEQEKVEHHACWKKGVYPDDNYIWDSIRAGEMWVAVVADVVVGSAVLNDRYNPGFADAPWLIKACPGEFSVLHTLAVSPLARRRGIAGAILKHLIEACRLAGKKSIRIDIIDNNMTIEPLYARYGFVWCGSLRLYYEAVGCQLFHLYELALS